MSSTFLSDHADLIARATRTFEPFATHAADAAPSLLELALRQVPEAFRETLRSGRVVETAALRAVRAVGVEPRRSLVLLTGPNDASKSFALAALLVSRGGGVWLEGRDLAEAWTTDAERLITAPLVVVDDLGHNCGSLERRALLAEVLDELAKRRCQAHLPLAITTQFTLETFAHWLQSGREHQRDHASGESVPERWARFRQRLLEHGVRPPIAELAELDGRVVMPGVVELACEGLREAQHRQQILERRARVRSRPTRGGDASTMRLPTGQPVVWVGIYGFQHVDDVTEGR